GVRRHLESIKRFTVLQLSLIGLLIYTAVYAFAWFKVYYPVISSPFISQDGYDFGPGLKLYFKGHLLILMIYLMILWFLSVNNGSMKMGYLKTRQIAWNQIIALAFTNVISYAQISLMRNWLVSPKALMQCYLIQIVLALLWTTLAGYIYQVVFAPRETLIIYGSDYDNADEIARRFEDSNDRFKVMKTMSMSGGVNAVEAECSRWYGCVVLYGVYGTLRKEIVDFCYSHYIRVFIVPDVDDLLMRGFEKMDLWDTPILELKEYSVSWEMRLIKRAVDICVSLVLIVITSPVLLISSLVSRGKTGHAIDKSICMSKDGRTFERHMLSYDCFGCTLPMLWDVLRGHISLIGPEPMKESMYRRLVDKDNRFIYRLRVKPGYTGYALSYGRSLRKLPDDCDIKDAESILKLDMVYIQEYSIMQDLRLMFGLLGSSDQRGKESETR
ncbi:MAG: sugar transferase, partial [Lachnospiraceae bacterium]|nr:sugar transferase [Lachnospiraceae bacterium]